MKKQFVFTLCFSLGLFLTLVGCKKDKVAPMSERIAKTWIIESVKHNNVLVYAVNGTSNTYPGYSNFKLSLGPTKSAMLTEWDNVTFMGSWTTEGDIRLKLSGLGPEPPTGTNGAIDYTIRSIDDTRLVLVRTSESVKTGNTINEYTLVQQP